MDMRSMVAFEVTKNDRKYVFSMEMGVPFGEAYDAAFEVLKEISDMAANAAKRAERPQEVVAEVAEPAN